MWFHLFQIHFKLLHWQFSLSYEVRRLQEEIECVNAEVARTKAGYEGVEECTAKTMAKVAIMAAELQDVAITIQGQKLRRAELLRRHANLLSQNSVLRQHLDMPMADKDHASTQTDPLPSVVTSPSLVAGPQSPPPADDAPDMPPDSPSDGGKLAFCRQLKYMRKLGAVI